MVGRRGVAFSARWSDVVVVSPSRRDGLDGSRAFCLDARRSGNEEAVRSFGVMASHFVVHSKVV